MSHVTLHWEQQHHGTADALHHEFHRLLSSYARDVGRTDWEETATVENVSMSDRNTSLIYIYIYVYVCIYGPYNLYNEKYFLFPCCKSAPDNGTTNKNRTYFNITHPWATRYTKTVHLLSGTLWLARWMMNYCKIVLNVWLVIKQRHLFWRAHLDPVRAVYPFCEQQHVSCAGFAKYRRQDLLFYTLATCVCMARIPSPYFSLLTHSQK
jgi:hypothetical protein